jgi:atonal protein 8
MLASGRDEDDNRIGALDEELSPKTECSEDSVEIRSTPMRIHRSSLKTQIILRPNAVLAASAHSSSSLKRPNNNNCLNKMSNWTDSEQPDEKRMRLMGQQHPPPPLPPLPPLTHFYHPASVQHQNVLKLAGGQQQQHPHELLLLEAERNRLFHHWMRPNNWPPPPPVQGVHHPTVETSAAHHLMTSALHYHYPHLIQQGNYNLPPHPFLHPSPPTAAAFNLSYGHLLPHPIFHHHRPPAFFSSLPSSTGVKPLPPLSPVCPRSITPPPPPPPSILGPLPPLVPVDGPASPRRLPDFNQKKCQNISIVNASGESSTLKRKKLKKSAIHPSGRNSSQKESRRKVECFNDSPRMDRQLSGKNVNLPSAACRVPLFLSVETLLSRDKPIEKIQPEEDHAELLEEEDDDDVDEDEEEEIQWRNFQPSGLPRTSSTMANSSSHRNYKNMTRERRMQANARERTRVHTISSAFEALRRAVPSFSHGQRLSKLSILRVASAYIAALGQLASAAADEEDKDKDEESTSPQMTSTGQLDECVDRCTRTLMTEGQLLRRNRKRSGVTNGRPGTNNATDDEDD